MGQGLTGVRTSQEVSVMKARWISLAWRDEYLLWAHSPSWVTPPDCKDMEFLQTLRKMKQKMKQKMNWNSGTHRTVCTLVRMHHGLTKALGADGGGLDSFQVNIKSEETYVAVPHLQKVFWTLKHSAWNSSSTHHPTSPVPIQWQIQVVLPSPVSSSSSICSFIVIKKKKRCNYQFSLSTSTSPAAPPAGGLLMTDETETGRECEK